MNQVGGRRRENKRAENNKKRNGRKNEEVEAIDKGKHYVSVYGLLTRRSVWRVCVCVLD